MHFTPAFSLFALALSRASLAAPDKRQGIPPTTHEDSQIITTPADGTSVMANTPFNFGVQSAPHDAQQCLSPYTPVDVYLLDTKPTTSNLNSTFQFSDYLYYFGNWTLVWTISTLPPYGSPPPSQLTMPDLGASQLRQPVYLAVIEDISECFPGYTDYSIDSRDLVYSGG